MKLLTVEWVYGLSLNREPKFKLPYNEIIVKAFGKDFTLTPDTYEHNEYVQQSIGTQIGLKVNTDE